MRDACRRQPPLRPHPARESLELPLIPLPAARVFARCYFAALAMHVVQLLLSAHGFMAAAMTALGVLTLFAMRQMLPQGGNAPRRLLLAADGRLHVACVDGTLEQVEICEESAWLSSALLLVLQAPGRRHRVLLGRGNLEPMALAALRRRLRGGTAVREATPVDSDATGTHANSLIQQYTRGNPD
jgi:hypothetical protein